MQRRLPAAGGNLTALTQNLGLEAAPLFGIIQAATTGKRVARRYSPRSRFRGERGRLGLIDPAGLLLRKHMNNQADG